jgi:mono/diheme cytochrome c family protein
LSAGLFGLTLTILFLTHGPAAIVRASANPKRRGAQLFATTGCVHCHGVAGISGGKGPSLADVRKRRKPEEIYTQIHDGGKSMPAFGEQLRDDQIKDLVKYLRSKRKAPGQ